MNDDGLLIGCAVQGPIQQGLSHRDWPFSIHHHDRRPGWVSQASQAHEITAPAGPKSYDRCLDHNRQSPYQGRQDGYW